MEAQGVFRWMQACVFLLLCLSQVLPAAAAAHPPETSRNYYDTLNVEPTATDSQIKKSFRKLAMKYHPDKNKSADAEKTFREIAEAYKVLSNKEQRRLYDNIGHDAFVKKDSPVHSEDEHDASSFFSFTEFFHDFDDGSFVEEPVFHFYQGGEDEGGQYEHYSFEDPGFTFFFGDAEADEEDLYF
ncbi:DnaJ-like protein subfamily B member 9 Microvascular endothelial differentiation gene 1 protein [Larimichthys crocea]|uniref:DnaJ homolog subfamily B member 9 n=1 Tax=Larimichthys crocea TaxID=215358 RepID=A0A6G0J515_LARCR|nr:DnaJ-like protein subfamily B member 9 Microvascular endothelial differentiation gene 1 protein [Larimichthys crocea]